MRMGLPKVITSDQGTEFNSKLDRELMKLLNIEHRLTASLKNQIAAILKTPTSSFNINLLMFKLRWEQMIAASLL